MSSEYLAMYLGVQPTAGAEHIIIPVRHFAADRHRLGRAITGNKLFTDFETARIEIDIFWTNKSNTMAFLLDSNLPGRENIIKGKAVRNFKMLFELFNASIKKIQGIPVLNGPQVGSVCLAFGVKTTKDPYPTGFLSNEFYARKIFSKEGYFLRASESGDFQLLPGSFNSHNFLAVEFTGMSLYDTDYYRTYV